MYVCVYSERASALACIKSTQMKAFGLGSRCVCKLGLFVNLRVPTDICVFANAHAYTCIDLCACVYIYIHIYNVFMK
jgi:hypothetical protein